MVQPQAVSQSRINAPSEEVVVVLVFGKISGEIKNGSYFEIYIVVSFLLTGPIAAVVGPAQRMMPRSRRRSSAI